MLRLFGSEIFSYANEFKIHSYFLVFRDHCIWFDVDAFDHVHLSFVQVDKYRSTFILLHADIQSTFVEDAVFCPIYLSGFFQIQANKQ